MWVITKSAPGEKLLNNIRVLAAGSLRLVWPELIDAFKAHQRINVETEFGPAGLLCQRIQQGETCHLFASANAAHPQTLLTSGKALSVAVFTHNQLCLSVKTALISASADWLALLTDPSLRVATSTPQSDPSGDYTWQLFDLIEQHYAGRGNALKDRALQLVGGPKSPVVPAGEMAASWLLENDRADIFIGYRNYAARLKNLKTLTVLDIPSPFQVQADYALAICQAEAQPLADFLLTAQAKRILQQAGFSC